MTTTPLAAALQARRSVRGFLPEPLSQEVLSELFALAQRAPSWCNIQPWRVVVTAPPVTETVRQALVTAARSGLPAPELPFPLDYPEPYREQRKQCGAALYGAMGIARDDKAARYDAWLRNYQLFDAPHLAVVSRDRRLGEYATLDLGVWLGVLLTAAASLGIDACPMASIAAYPQPLRTHLEISQQETIVFGVALGREDASVAANRCRTSRLELAECVRFAGF